MSDTVNASAEHLTEQAIARWRQKMRHVSPARLVELEDHLCSELEQLQDTSLSPDERVLVAAERLGDPGPWRLRLSINRTGLVVMAVLIVALPVAMALLQHGAWELNNEIDDWLELCIGDTLQDLLEDATPIIVTVTLLAVWGWLSRVLLRRHVEVKLA